MDISRLRRETASDHQAVEGVIPLMAPDLDNAAYVRCLRRIHGIVAAWEEQAYRVAPEWLRESLALRERRPMLAADLASFGCVPSVERAPLPALEDISQMLGAMYVMEGSTLGGQLIARHVEKTLGFERGVGDAFFVGHGEQTGSLWKEFCSMLETRVPELETDAVVLGAKAMFVAFAAWMQENPVPIDG